MTEELALAVNRFSTLSLDIQGGSFAEGALLQQFNLHAGGNQRWRIIDLGLPAEVHGIPGASVLTSLQYQIVAAHSGAMALTPHANNTQVVQFGRAQVPAIAASLGQVWHLVPFGDGQYVLRNKRQGTVLGLKSPSKTVGVEAELRPYAAADATQRWDLLFKLAAPSPAYQVGMILNPHSKKVLDVRALNPADEAVVQQSTYNGGLNQRFSFIYDSSRATTITANHSGKLLALGPYSGPRAPLVQRTMTGRDTRWLLWGYGEGFTIEVADRGTTSSDFVLDVPSGSKQEGLELQVYFPRHHGANQIWQIWVYR